LALLDDRISRSEHHTAEQSIQDQSGVDCWENLQETLVFSNQSGVRDFFPSDSAIQRAKLSPVGEHLSFHWQLGVAMHFPNMGDIKG